jgi:hypothetical protein
MVPRPTRKPRVNDQQRPAPQRCKAERRHLEVGDADDSVQVLLQKGGVGLIVLDKPSSSGNQKLAPDVPHQGIQVGRHATPTTDHVLYTPPSSQ